MSKCTVKVLSHNEQFARLIILLSNELDFNAALSKKADGNINIIDSPFDLPSDFDPSRCIYLCNVGEAIQKGVEHFLAKPFLWDDFKALLDNFYEHIYGSMTERLLLEGRELIYKGKSVLLSETEAKLFSFLQKRANKPVSREMLLKNVWKKESEKNKANITDVYINYLRQKLKENFGINVIDSVRGVGYMYKE